MRIAITGHRPSKLGNDYDLVSPLIKSIEKILQELIDTYQPTEMISGMALGIDTLWAELAIKNNIKLIAAIPCKNQTERWPIKSITRHSEILSYSLCTAHYVSDKMYTSSCMQIRNQWMVDNSDLLIAVYDGSSGGTANCVRYAESKEKDYVLISPIDLSVSLPPRHKQIISDSK